VDYRKVRNQMRGIIRIEELIRENKNKLKDISPFRPVIKRNPGSVGRLTTSKG
jgi:hypothetical protein